MQNFEIIENSPYTDEEINNIVDRVHHAYQAGEMIEVPAPGLEPYKNLIKNPKLFQQTITKENTTPEKLITKAIDKYLNQATA